MEHDDHPQYPPRYYLAIGDGQSYGPYTMDELRGFIAEGRVRGGAMLCLEGKSDWIPAGHLMPELKSPPSAPPPWSDGPVPSVPNARRIKLGWAMAAMVSTLVLATCTPIGIVALVYARKANERYARGDVDGGQSAERAYRGWLIASWVIVAVSLYLTWASVNMCMSFADQFG